jgi:hypothetical protein
MKQVLDFLKNHTTLILAIVSGYLYLCSYFFELSYLQVFDIPNDYLSIDLNTILSDSSKIIQLISVAIFIYKIVKLPFRKWMSKSYINDYVGTTICFSASLLFLARTASIIPNSWLRSAFFVWIITVIVTVFFVVKSYIYCRKDNTIKDNNEQEIDDKSHTNRPPFLDTYFKIILLVLFPIFICGFIGEGIATKVTHLPMINDSTKYLVIRKYGDQLLCKDYDFVNKKLGKQIIIVKIPINKPIVLISYEVGNLYERKFLEIPNSTIKPAAKVIKPTKVSSDTLK